MLKCVHWPVEAAMEMLRTVYGGGGEGVRRPDWICEVWICENARGTCVVVGRMEAVVARRSWRTVGAREVILEAGALVL